MLLAWKRIPAKGKQNHSESVLSFTEWFVRSERVSESRQFHSRPAAMLAAELNWTELKGTNQFMKWFSSLRSLKRFVRSNDTFANNTTLVSRSLDVSRCRFRFLLLHLINIFILGFLDGPSPRGQWSSFQSHHCHLLACTSSVSSFRSSWTRLQVGRAHLSAVVYIHVIKFFKLDKIYLLWTHTPLQ